MASSPSKQEVCCADIHALSIIALQYSTELKYYVYTRLLCTAFAVCVRLKLVCSLYACVVAKRVRAIAANATAAWRGENRARRFVAHHIDGSACCSAATMKFTRVRARAT